jgi:hypothetical protein
LLAGKLLKNADETDDATARFVLLSEARNVAADIGDAKVALGAARRIDELYQDKPAAETIAAITALRRVNLSPAASGDVAFASLHAIDVVLSAEDLPACAKLAAAAVDTASRSGEPDLAAAARERAVDLRAAIAESGRISADRKTLEDRPTDPKACNTVGRFLCFTLGLWDRGLPLLRHAQDAKLRQLALLDHAETTDPKVALGLADGWFALAESSHGLMRVHLVERAMAWYRTILPQLTGLARLRAEKQLAAITSTIKPWDPIAYSMKSTEHGIDLGMADRNVTNSFLVEFELRTTWARHGILLTKRQAENDGSLTFELRADGGVNLYGDASWYSVQLKGKSTVNDGQWHIIRVEKQGFLARLFIDGKLEGTLETRLAFKSKSPWVIGWHGVWNKGAMDGEIRHVRIQSGK